MADIKEITLNNSTYDIKAKSVVDQGGGSLKMWTGTQAEYDAITSKDSNTLYYVTDGHAIFKGDDLVVNLANRNIGEIISSTLPLTDASLHLLDGALIDGSGIYSDFVDYMGELYAASPSANYFTTESAWQTSVTNYGVCGKFVYDSVNNTVRLPKITGIIEGTTDVSALGDLVQAGLPNITSSIGVRAGVDAPDGMVNTNYSRGANTNGCITHTDSVQSVILSTSASLSSPIYGNSSTVQPQTIKTLYYIVIATSTKTDIQVDIDEIATDLNGKASTSLDNLNSTGEKHFLNKTQVTNCILEAPNGILTASGAVLTAHQGLKVLIPNGKNSDGTLKNTEYTISSDITFTYNYNTYLPNDIIFIRSNGVIIRLNGNLVYRVKAYSDLSTKTGSMQYRIAYVEDDNKWYYTGDTASTWTHYLICPLGSVRVQANNTISDIHSLDCMNVLSMNDRDFLGAMGMPSGKETVFAASPDNIGLPSQVTQYTATANGYAFLYMQFTSGYAILNNSTHNINGILNASSFGSFALIPVKKGDTFTYNPGGASNIGYWVFKFIEVGGNY